MSKVEIKKINLHNKNGVYYLDLEVNSEEDDGSVLRLSFPRIRLFDKKPKDFNITMGDSYDYYHTEYYLTIGDHEFRLDSGKAWDAKFTNKYECYYLKEIIKEADPKEMTLDEIEKQLGYKVKVINKETK